MTYYSWMSMQNVKLRDLLDGLGVELLGNLRLKV